MKKQCLSVILFFYSSFIICQWSLGPSIGIYNNSFTEDDQAIFNSNSTQTSYFGLSTKYQISERFNFWSDLEYAQKGYKVSVSSIPEALEFRFRFLDIQPYITYNLFNKVNLGLGVFIGYNFSEKTRFGTDLWENSTNKEAVKNEDFGLLANAQIQLGVIMIKIEYNMGLLDVGNLVLTDINGNVIGGADQKTRTIQLGFSYLFDLSKTNKEELVE